MKTLMVAVAAVLVTSNVSAQGPSLLLDQLQEGWDTALANSLSLEYPGGDDPEEPATAQAREELLLCLDGWIQQCTDMQSTITNIYSLLTYQESIGQNVDLAWQTTVNASQQVAAAKSWLELIRAWVIEAQSDTAMRSYWFSMAAFGIAVEVPNGETVPTVGWQNAAFNMQASFGGLELVLRSLIQNN